MLFSLFWYNFIQQTSPDKLCTTNFRSFQRGSIRLCSGILSKSIFFCKIMVCCTSNLRNLGNHCYDSHSSTIKIQSHLWSKSSLLNTLEMILKGRKMYGFSSFQDIQTASQAQACGCACQETLSQQIFFFVMLLGRYLVNIILQ